jgi:hypothetical protein
VTLKIAVSIQNYGFVKFGKSARGVDKRQVEG